MDRSVNQEHYEDHLFPQNIRNWIPKLPAPDQSLIQSHTLAGTCHLGSFHR